MGIPYRTQYTPLFDHQREVIGILFIGIPVAQVEAILSQGHAASIRNLALSALVVILIAVMAWYYIGSSITKPIIELQKKIDRLANYDLRLDESSSTVQYQRRDDEIGGIARSLTTMQQNLTQLIREIYDESDQVAAAS